MDTLWNIIRDFFVRFVFGGTDSVGDFYNSQYFGSVYGEGGFADTQNPDVYVPINLYNGNSEWRISYMSFPDWLSTTSTIIILVALFIGITMLIIKLFKFVSNAISMR